MTRITRPGRPLGAKARAILQLVSDRPFTVRALSSELQLSYGDAQRTVYRLVQTGQVSYGDCMPSTGGRAPRLVQTSAPEPVSAVRMLEALFARR